MLNVRREVWRPNQKQHLLLAAALGLDASSIEAWEQWKRLNDFNAVSQGTYRLLPLVYRNLQRNGFEDPLREKLKGIYRLTWSKNQLLFNNVGTILNGLEQNGIPTIVMKGAALALLHYRDVGVRPMNDLDILIRNENAGDVIAALLQGGWEPAIGVNVRSLKDCFKYSHAVSMRHPVSGHEIDIHSRIVLEGTATDSWQWTWNRSVPVQLGNAQTRAIDPTTLLFQVLVHGVRWNTVSPIRWFADAVTIIRSSSALIDWNRIIRWAEHEQLILPVRETMLCIAESSFVDIPGSVVEELKKSKPRLISILEYRSNAGPHTLVHSFFVRWFEHVRIRRNSSVFVAIVTFPLFLKNKWKITHVHQLPFAIIRKIIGRSWNIEHDADL